MNVTARRIAFVAFAFALANASYAAGTSTPTASNAGLPERIVLDATELVLNGAGVLAESSLDRYAVGLYLTRPQSRLDSVLADKGRKRIVLSVLRTTTAARLIEMFSEAIAANHTESELESIKAPLSELYALFGKLGTARPGATIAIDYVPGTGTQVLLPGAASASVIRGSDVYPAVLRAWLGIDPIDRRLRAALLGVRIEPSIQ